MRNLFISNRYFLIIVTFLIALTFSSCVQYKVIKIQTLKPAELSIPRDFSQPLILANLYRGIEGVRESMAQAALDSTAALEAVLVLAESLYDSPWFQGVDIPVKVNYRDDSSHLIIPLEWKKVESLASEYNADMLISLEYIKVTPKTESYPFWDGSMRSYYGYLTMNVYAFWRVYNLNNLKVVADYLHRDTLTWEKYDYYTIRVGDQLPGFFSSASYSGYTVGLEYARKIAPSWMDEQRIYYSRGSKEMRKAAEFAERNQWLDAAAQWQIILRKQKVKSELAAKAAFNMAVANEMAGNFDVALEWLDKSADFFTLPEGNWYRRIIELRIKLLEKL